MEETKEKICREIDALSADIKTISSYLHANPETAYQEVKSSAYLAEYLTGKGFTVQSKAGGVDTAFLARPEGAQPNRPTAAFLAEYDALPKLGHGCGHNLIAAASLTGALGLLRAVPELAGGIAVAGTPAEEGGGGKEVMAKAGVFENIDMAIMYHPGQQTLASKGMLGRIKFTVEFFGKTAHASGAPDKGINALDAMVLAYCAISALRQQMSPAGRVHGIITHGGDAPNIIPDYAAGLFYVRGESIQYRDELFEKVKNCVEGAAKATGAQYKIEVAQPVIDSFKQNMALAEAITSNLNLLGIPLDKDDGRRGSSDIGNLSHALPCAHPTMTIVDQTIANHTVEFCEATLSERGQTTTLNAAKMLALTVYDYLTTPELQEKVRKEFAE